MKNSFFKKYLTFVLLLSFIVPTSFIHAQVLGIPAAITALRKVGIPFGGPIIVTIPCTCSKSLLVKVYDFRTFTSLSLHYSPPFSFLYLLYNLVTPGVMTLGTFSLKGPTCMVYSGNSCTVVPSDGVIDFLPGVGTGGIPFLPI